ncbi:MAG: gliding motility-associated C-terminal domain-containing protein [Vicingus serpentipes]|nr:gliding motility-associated C-terminal domain-containing protein [Vicingus serpentipes]
MKRIIFFTLWITIYSVSLAQNTHHDNAEEQPQYQISEDGKNYEVLTQEIVTQENPSDRISINGGPSMLVSDKSSGHSKKCPLNVTLINRVNDDCAISCGGSLTASVTGGGGILSYQWYRGLNGDFSSPIVGEVFPTINNLCGGDIVHVVVTDPSGPCTFSYQSTVLTGTSSPGVSDSMYVNVWTSYPLHGGKGGPPWYVCEGECNQRWIGDPNDSSPAGIGILYSSAGGPFDITWHSLGLSGSNLFGKYSICAPVGAPFVDSVTVTDQACISTTVVTTINVRVNPVVTFDTTTSISCFGVCDGEVLANVSGSVSTPFSYQWSGGKGTTPSATGLCGGVTYLVRVTDTSFCQSGLVPVSIPEPTELTVSMTSTPENCVNSCDGQAEAFANGGTPPYTYDWGSGPIADSTINTLCAGLTTVTVTDDNNCTKQGSVTLTPPSPIIAEAGNDQQICVGSSAQLNASGGSTYSWSPTTGLSNPNIANPVASPSVTTKYFVTVGAAGCQETDSVTITTIPQPTITIAPSTDTTLCDNMSLQLIASGGASYTWTPSTGLNNAAIPNPVATPTSDITYTVTGVGANGCTNIDTLHISLIPAPIPTITSDTSVCIGSNMQLLASGGVNYLWSPTSGLNNPNISNPIATPSATTTYTATVTAANGCQETASVLLTVNPLPISTMSDSVFICDTNGTMLSANGGTSYLWSPAGTLSDPNIANPIATPSVTTTYYVLITDNNGCSITDTVVAKIDTTGTGGDVNFTYSPMARCEGIDIAFTNTSLNPGTDAFTWDFGDGTSSTELSPTHLYPFGSTVTVTLTREASGGGCTGSNSISFSLGDFNNFVNLNPPNVFSPNDDGLNDFFTLDLDGDFKDCFEIEIYNRWGATVYKNNNGNKWDGKLSSGKDVPQGTYYYILKIGDATIARSLTLLR